MKPSRGALGGPDSGGKVTFINWLRSSGQSTEPRAGVQVTEHCVPWPRPLLRSVGHLEVEGGDRAACDTRTNLHFLHIPLSPARAISNSLPSPPPHTKIRTKLITNKSQRKAKLW